MKRLRLFLAATLCLLLIASAGPTGTAKDTWTSVRSKKLPPRRQCQRERDQAGGGAAGAIPRGCSRLFAKANFNSPVPTTVVVFKNDSSYRPFKPNANTAGYFQAGPDVNYITLKTEVNDEQNPFNVIFHEYTHSC